MLPSSAPHFAIFPTLHGTHWSECLLVRPQILHGMIPTVFQIFSWYICKLPGSFEPSGAPKTQEFLFTILGVAWQARAWKFGARLTVREAQPISVAIFRWIRSALPELNAWKF